jgi:hypothetical protein
MYSVGSMNYSTLSYRPSYRRPYLISSHLVSSRLVSSADWQRPRRQRQQDGWTGGQRHGALSAHVLTICSTFVARIIRWWCWWLGASLARFGSIITPSRPLSWTRQGLKVPLWPKRVTCLGFNPTPSPSPTPARALLPLRRSTLLYCLSLARYVPYTLAASSSTSSQPTCP